MKVRANWKEKEVLEVLKIIKHSSYAVKLHGAGTKRNNKIYEAISRELAAKQIYRSAVQIRTKFKALKQDYFHRRRNNTMEAAIQDSSYYKLLIDILENQATENAKEADAEATEAPSEDCTEDVHYSGDNTNDAFEMDVFDMKEEMYDMNRVGAVMVPNQRTESEDECYNNAEQSRPRKRTYEGILQSFTDEWKQQQELFIEDLRNLDDRNFERIGQEQAAILRRHREEMESILERDRFETERMLNAIVNRFLDQGRSTTHSIDKLRTSRRDRNHDY